MSSFVRRYQQGFYLEVYQELLDLQEHIFDADVYEDILDPEIRTGKGPEIRYINV